MQSNVSLRVGVVPSCAWLMADIGRLGRMLLPSARLSLSVVPPSHARSTSLRRGDATAAHATQTAHGPANRPRPSGPVAQARPREWRGAVVGQWLQPSAVGGAPGGRQARPLVPLGIRRAALLAEAARCRAALDGAARGLTFWRWCPARSPCRPPWHRPPCPSPCPPCPPWACPSPSRPRPKRAPSPC